MIQSPPRWPYRASGPQVERVHTASVSKCPEGDALVPVIPRSVLSTMAHEIRGPLSAMALSSELILDDLDSLGPEEVRSLAQRISRGALWLQGLIDNVLCDAALGEGRFQLSLEKVDVIELVNEVQELLQPLVVGRGQKLGWVVDSPLPAVQADRNRLTQVLLNLVLNASKFSPQGTPIVIALSALTDAIRVDVTDRGCGFEVEATALFERFFRTDRARQDGVIGSGLGLSIVKAIVNAHGGWVGAENRPNGGARFWFEIPTTPVWTGEL
ncbi:MAG TPA: HAMP domain-containing sensor histidine kinase [Chloroflexota bacterium]|nr:HAMP domain-containing sensor histidine kinase [Chloroflexota bacterium]